MEEKKLVCLKWFFDHATADMNRKPAKQFKKWKRAGRRDGYLQASVQKERSIRGQRAAALKMVFGVLRQHESLPLHAFPSEQTVIDDSDRSTRLLLELPLRGPALFLPRATLCAAINRVSALRPDLMHACGFLLARTRPANNIKGLVSLDTN
jgi:hypothetical protein